MIVARPSADGLGPRLAPNSADSLQDPAPAQQCIAAAGAAQRERAQQQPLQRMHECANYTICDEAVAARNRCLSSLISVSFLHLNMLIFFKNVFSPLINVRFLTLKYVYFVRYVILSSHIFPYRIYGPVWRELAELWRGHHGSPST